MLGLRDEVVAYCVDEALAIRLGQVEHDAQAAVASRSPFASVDRVLRGLTPRTTPDGLRYQDPRALYREEMARRAAESGQVH